jgi:hypothetical protein
MSPSLKEAKKEIQEGRETGEKGIIISRSPLANEDGMYTLTIESPFSGLLLSGEYEIQFPITTDFYYLPKEILEIKNQTSGFIYLLNNQEVQKLPIELGNQRNDFIEVKTPLNPATQIITHRTSLF